VSGIINDSVLDESGLFRIIKGEPPKRRTQLVRRHNRPARMTGRKAVVWLAIVALSAALAVFQPWKVFLIKGAPTPQTNEPARTVGIDRPAEVIEIDTKTFQVRRNYA
jgi:hypothetical protein